MLDVRMEVAGKYSIAARQKWFVKGVNCGPFAPNSTDQFLPDMEQLRADFAQLHPLRTNCVRVCHPLVVGWGLDIAFEAGISQLC